MADGSGSNGTLYFIVGALSVAVAVGAFVMFGGGGTVAPSTAQAPAAASAPAPAPTTKNVTIEKKVVEPTKIIEHDRR